MLAVATIVSTHHRHASSSQQTFLNLPQGSKGSFRSTELSFKSESPPLWGKRMQLAARERSHQFRNRRSLIKDLHWPPRVVVKFLLPIDTEDMVDRGEHVAG